MSKKCIVCGKPIRKITRDYYFHKPVEAREEVRGERMGHPFIETAAREAKPEGLIERGRYQTQIYTANPPQTKDDCSRYTNEQIVSVRRAADGSGISRFSAWDGETYADPYFHAGICAQSQGYASAQHGHRYIWKDKES